MKEKVVILVVLVVDREALTAELEQEIQEIQVVQLVQDRQVLQVKEMQLVQLYVELVVEVEVQEL